MSTNIISNYCMIKINDARKENKKEILVNSKEPIIDKFFDEANAQVLSECVRDINGMGCTARIMDNKDIHITL